MKYLTIIILFLNTSCAYFKLISAKKQETKKLHGELKYEFVDTMGSFIKSRNKGFDSSKNLVIKSKIYQNSNEQSPVERLISISKMGEKINKINIVRPLKSEAIYWFDGNKYKSYIEFDEKNNQYISKAIAKEDTWDKYQKVKIDIGKKAYCFFSQLIECIEHSGFLKLSREKYSGAMNIEVIWDGFPFFNEQYLNNKKSMISTGKFKFLQKEAKGIYKYALNIDGQVIHYFIYDDKHLAKMFWVSQGISQTLME